MHYTSKEEATAAAEVLRAKMRDPKVWTPEIFHSNIWQFSLTCGNVTLLPARIGGTFICQVCPDPSDAHHTLDAWEPSYDDSCYEDPQVAVDVAIRCAEAYVAKLTKALQAAYPAFGAGT